MATATKKGPGRPPAGVGGSKVRSYPKIRIDPVALVLLRKAAKATGEALHAVASAAIRRGLK